MPAAAPQRQRVPESPSRLRVLPQEAQGILIIAGLVLILTLVRYWHHISWFAR